MKKLFADIGSKLVDYKEAIEDKFSIDELRGNESKETLQELVSLMNAHYGLEVSLIVTEDSPHGGFVSIDTLERNREYFPGILKRAESASEKFGKDGLILIHPSFRSMEVTAHEYGHAVYRSRYGLRHVIGEQNSIRVIAVINATSTVASMATFAMKANRPLGMAFGFAVSVPTLIGEAYASLIAKEYLVECLKYDMKTKGLKKAYGTYVAQSVMSAFGGDLNTRVARLFIAFK